jgi:hypothetical protein
LIGALECETPFLGMRKNLIGNYVVASVKSSSVSQHSIVGQSGTRPKGPREVAVGSGDWLVAAGFLLARTAIGGHMYALSVGRQ